ncbi:hypothetical protein QYF36_008743 [Acer negundo]|nr:hypothetical protein QYF36_008743 [Acer negundo]
MDMFLQDEEMILGQEEFADSRLTTWVHSVAMIIEKALLDMFMENRSIKLWKNDLHVAVKFGDEKMVAKILEESPELALESDHGGNTALHFASDQGNLGIVRLLLKSNPQLCLLKNRCEYTPLHMAVMRDRVDMVRELLSACPESVFVVSATDETPLHVAIRHCQESFLELLIESIQKRSDYVHIINKKDCAGNTVLHLAIARKHFNIIRLLLSERPTCYGKVDVNAMNDGGFTVLDILDVLPHEGKRDVDIEMILQREGAMRATDLGKVILDDEKWIESQRNGDRSSHLQPIWYWPRKARRKTPREAYHVMLVTAALILAITFQAALNAPGSKVVDNIKYKSSSSLGFQVGKQSSNYLLRLFIWFDSIAFITSAASMIIILVHEKPLKPWMLISVLSIYGAYICTIMAVSPRDALAVFLLGSPPILLASMSKHLALHSDQEIVSQMLQECPEYALHLIVKATSPGALSGIYSRKRRLSVGYFPNPKVDMFLQDEEMILGQQEFADSRLTTCVHSVAMIVEKAMATLLDMFMENGSRKLWKNDLHVAVKLGDEKMVAKILKESPELALESDLGGDTALHLACDEGNLAMVRLLVKSNPELCLLKNIYERTPMHMAVMRGRVDVAFELLKACPESIMVVSTTEETPLHVAVIRLFLSEGPSCNGKVDVNVMNYGGFTALDILDVLPQEGKRDVDIEMILQREGAMRATDLVKVILDDEKWGPIITSTTYLVLA